MELANPLIIVKKNWIALHVFYSNIQDFFYRNEYFYSARMHIHQRILKKKKTWNGISTEI